MVSNLFATMFHQNIEKKKKTVQLLPVGEIFSGPKGVSAQGRETHKKGSPEHGLLDRSTWKALCDAAGLIKKKGTTPIRTPCFFPPFNCKGRV